MADQIDAHELLDATEVAELLRLARRTSVSVYRRRYQDFPEPVIEKSRCVLWRRSDVVAWAQARSRPGEEGPTVGFS